MRLNMFFGKDYWKDAPMESNKGQSVLIAFDIADKEHVYSIDNGNAIDRIIICKTFFADRLIGSFFSCVYNGKLRIHLVFNAETSLFNGEISELIKCSMKIAGMGCGTIWFRKTTQELIGHVSSEFILTPLMEEFYYHSTEYIMRREAFCKKFDNAVLDVRPYEEKFVDQYLHLLNDAMSFFVPPSDFVGEKERYLQAFLNLQKKNAFEAFWKDGELVGLYWLEGIEVDTIGVATKHQRFGYGAMILTRAIETIFRQNTETEIALLYCVGWNAKAQNFYKSYGMEMRNQHKVPYNAVNPV